MAFHIVPFLTIALIFSDSLYRNSFYRCHTFQIYQDLHFGNKCRPNFKTPLVHTPTYQHLRNIKKWSTNPEKIFLLDYLNILETTRDKVKLSKKNLKRKGVTFFRKTISQ